MQIVKMHYSVKNMSNIKKHSQKKKKKKIKIIRKKCIAKSKMAGLTKKKEKNDKITIKKNIKNSLK